MVSHASHASHTSQASHAVLAACCGVLAAAYDRLTQTRAHVAPVLDGDTELPVQVGSRLTSAEQIVNQFNSKARPSPSSTTEKNIEIARPKKCIHRNAMARSIC